MGLNNKIRNVIKETLIKKLTEKAESKAQQKAAGIALAAKRGEIPYSDLKGASKEMYNMSEKDLEDFASTKHDNLPNKVKKESVNENLTDYLTGSGFRNQIDAIMKKAGFKDREDYFISVKGGGDIKFDVYKPELVDKMQKALQKAGLKFTFNKMRKVFESVNESKLTKGSYIKTNNGRVGKIDNVSSDGTIADITFNDGKRASMRMKDLQKFESLGELKLTKAHSNKIEKAKQLKGMIYKAVVDKKHPELMFVSFDNNSNKTKIIQMMRRLGYEFKEGGRSTNAPAIMGIAGHNWAAFKKGLTESIIENILTEATEMKDVRDVKKGDTIVIKKRNKPVHLKVDDVNFWSAGGKQFDVTDVKTGKKAKLKIKYLTTRTGPTDMDRGLADPTQVEVLKESLLTEGINDPGILKAVFLAGGPGSGKSFSAEQVFGIDNIMKGTSTTGLKVVNSDPAFELELKKRGVDPKNLGAMTDKVFKFYTSDKAGSARDKAKKIKTKLERIYHEGRLGLIIDGTGHDYAKIAKKKKRLEQLGYDTSMLFVNTSLPVALKRNSQRERVLPDDIVKDSWQAVQNNMGKFQTLFGSDFQILDNSEVGNFSKMHSDKIKAVNKMIKKPVQNPLGKQWIENEKKLRGLK
jgi:predicted kinase